MLPIYRYLLKKRANDIITEEKAKSDKLLLNILPVRIVNDLKQNGTTEPEAFDDVTVYFSDIVGFTKLSSHLEPKFLIDELNEIFTAFDNIMEKNNCERIKTIGDAYLAVCGLPVPNNMNVINIINSAIEIIEYLKDRNSKSEIEWKIRVGIHSGKVIGGVVGIKKYIYDVFGDTINTASRMETNSEPMRINISETTYKLTKNEYKFIEREPIKLKGKGIQKMYFIDI
ncbi:MAG: adenylate/guanylate cyclase domain-containing protein [Candidatus Celaenobacter antarcticus]|nr:adenylate/guanylate cyclase domain-containing protein [Candidatus Celaenobacter antarcticus]